MVAVTQAMQLDALDNDRRVVECRVRDSRGAEVYSVSLGYKGIWAGKEEKPVQFRSDASASKLGRYSVRRKLFTRMKPNGQNLGISSKNIEIKQL